MFDASTRLKLLRIILLADSIVLVLLGGLLIFAAEPMFKQFQVNFGDPVTLGQMKYIVAMWGALMATMGVGYFVASKNPASSQSWVIAGFTRAALEVAVSLIYVQLHAVKLLTASLGLGLGLWFAIFYFILYPRSESTGAASTANGGA